MRKLRKKHGCSLMRDTRVCTQLRVSPSQEQGGQGWSRGPLVHDRPLRGVLRRAAPRACVGRLLRVACFGCRWSSRGMACHLFSVDEVMQTRHLTLLHAGGGRGKALADKRPSPGRAVVWGCVLETGGVAPSLPSSPMNGSLGPNSSPV